MMSDYKVAVCIIARDSASTISDCIRSLRGARWIVLTDTGSKDGTIRLAKKAAHSIKAELILSRFTWIDDFAAARNYNFSQVPAEAEWLMWVDADDTVEGMELLPELIARTDKRFGAIWLPYFYAFDEFQNCTTIFIRERILRKSIGWTWRSRVHETVAPDTPTLFIKSSDIIIKHNHKTEVNRSERNFRLLHMMLKDEPENKRVWLYMAHQHFAEGNWVKATEWYLKFSSDPAAVPVERYQALTYAARALRNINDFKQAIDCDLLAIDTFPQWADGYLGMCLSNLGLGFYGKAAYWGEQAKTKQMPDEIIFVNPLDYTFNLSMSLAEAYARQGRIAEAISATEEAQKLRPVEETTKNLELLREGRSREETVRGLKALCNSLMKHGELTKLKSISQIIPWWLHEVPQLAEFQAAIRAGSSKPVLPFQCPDHYQPVVKYADLELTDVPLSDALYSLEQFADQVDLEVDHSRDRVRFVSQAELEQALLQLHRFVKQLYTDDNKLVCSFNHAVRRTGLEFRIVCGAGLERWSPLTIERDGIGGSELCAAALAKHLVASGHRAVLHGSSRGVWDGVVYLDGMNISPSDVLISSRIPEIFSQPVPARLSLLWLHDIDCWDRLTPAIAEHIDGIVVLSHWHLDHVKRVYPWLAGAEVLDYGWEQTYTDYQDRQIFHPDGKCSRLPKLIIMPDAIEPERFMNQNLPKVQHQLIWLSSPDRGLIQILELWDKLRAALPDATLKIYYGWNYFDKALQYPGMAEMKIRIQQLIKQPGVEWCGRVGQEAIAEALLSSDIWLYPPPHDFRETCCISALEAQAARVLCFYRMNGALGETAKYGYPLPLDSSQDFIVQTIKEAVSSSQSGESRGLGRAWALEQSWERSASQWLEMVDMLLKAKEG